MLDRNLRAMSERMRRHGVALRPHLKTAKSVDIARLAVGDNSGITVSTLREAEYFAEHGFVDLTYAVGVVPVKLDRVASLLRRGVRIRVLTDDPKTAGRIAERGAALAVRFPTLIEIDSGAHRGGLDPEDSGVIEIARVLDRASGAVFEGVLTHAGHSYECDGADAIRKVAEQERQAVVHAAERIRKAGLECAVVSAGSTPTAVFAKRFDGLTEMRPGNYMFFDLYQESLGTCRRGDIAVSVLASVIGQARRQERLLLDAGALALSLDHSAGDRAECVGYGIVTDLAGRPIGDLRVTRVHQEHGFVEAKGTVPWDTLPVGAKVRVLPNHSCATAAMFDRYYVTEDGERLSAIWGRTSGW